MNGQTYGREVAFNQTVINIGADSGNDIILKGESVADFHAMLHFENERWFIVSLDPSKTTNVNGHVLGDLAENLQNSSVVTIGDYRLFFNLNGVNADIMIQSQGIMSEGASVQTEAFGSNILLEITNSTMTEIEAGATAEFELTVTNAGPLVANMQLQLQGVPTSWVQVIPPVLNLNEGRKGIFSVRISPPRDSSAEAGFYGLHFVASSPNYQQETGIADSSLTVLPYSEFLASGPTPRRLELTRKNQTDLTDVVILNNSNAATTFFVRSYDDANDLFFTYEREGSSQQGQETITIRPGDNTRVSMRIGSRKLPILGMRSHSYHYNTTITPSDQPGGGQSLMGEVVVKPLINTFWVLLTLFLLVVGAIVFFQPRIRHFDGDNGKRTLVALYGNPVRINWDVVPFASKVTMTDNSGEPQDMIKSGSQFIAPKVSSTYTLKAENIFSKMFNINYEKTIQVLVIPQSPTVSTLHTDISDALYNQQVTLNWAVSGDISKAALAYNKQKTDLTAENYTGTLAQGYTSDTLFSLKAQNSSGYDMRSLFLNVAPDRIDLKRFMVWVRPNGIAVPNNNDTRRTSRWSSLQLTADTNTSGIIRPAVNPMPDPQTNVLSIPDNYNNIGNSHGLNPEQIALSGQPNPNNGYVYSSPQVDVDNPELLVSPSLRPTVMPTAIPEAVLQTGPIVRETTVPPTSPEAAPYNRDFSVKLVEVVEDPLSESGYRIIDYFPDYQLQPKEQILVEWSVNGVSAVKITGLSGDSLRASGGDFAYPEKSLTYELEAEVGQVKKVYSLPVRVAGDADDGEGSGLKCELKANATTLKEPGSVMLSWTGGGTNRVQLVSSAKAEQDSEDAEKKKEQEAKEKGETYQKPSQPAQMTGGTIGDWLQPSGFMRVNVEKQTTFVLNAYDGNGNVICTKSVDVKLEGGNDKEDISKIPGASFRIVKIADDNGVSQPFYTVGQTVHYTIAMTGFPKGKEPSGSVVITDGTGSCTVTLPVTSCSFVAKKAGEGLTVTAVYSGDNTYKKAQATAKENVRAKLNTKIQILNPEKVASDRADFDTTLTWVGESYGKKPTGTITYTIIRPDPNHTESTCVLTIPADENDDLTVSCPNDKDKLKFVTYEDSIRYVIRNMRFEDPAADRMKAVYSGDTFFNKSESETILFGTITLEDIPTDLTFMDADKSIDDKINTEVRLTWDKSIAAGAKPAGTIQFESGTGSCTLTVSDIKPALTNCKAESISVKEVSKSDSASYSNSVGYSFVIRNLEMAGVGETLQAKYSGADRFQPSAAPEVSFGLWDTQTYIDNAFMVDYMPTVTFHVTWDKDEAGSVTPEGSVSLKIGTDTCVLSYDEAEPLKWKMTSCTGIDTEVSEVIEDDGKITWTVKNVLLSQGNEPDRAKATYAGDGLFNPSSSTEFLFETVETTLAISDQIRTPSGDVDLKLDLSWMDKPPAGLKPSGRITLTSGTASCTLDLDADPVKFMDCDAEKITDNSGGQKLSFTIEGLDMGSNAGATIKAEYSGDGTFLESETEEMDFGKLPTEIHIEKAYKTNPESVADVLYYLTWDKEYAEGKKPTGTLTLTIGSDVCKYDIASKKLEGCNGKDTRVVFVDAAADVDPMPYDEKNDAGYEGDFEKLLITSTTADRVKVDYSGDDVFNSSSQILLFQTIPTTLDIENQSKTGSGLVDVDAVLSWVDEPQKAGTVPAGTIKITMGSASCTLDISGTKSEYVFTDCEADPVPAPTDASDAKTKTYKITNLKFADVTGTEIKAEYSGDGLFLASASVVKSFDKIDTTLELRNAYKSETIRAFYDAVLGWESKKADNRKPTGTLTFTIGDTCKMVFSLTDNDTEKTNEDDPYKPIEFSCSDEKTKILMSNFDFDDTSRSYHQRTWTFKDVLLAVGNSADRIKAEYSGDAVFNPSTSEFLLLDTIPTTLDVSNQVKKAVKSEETGETSILVDMKVTLGWNKKPLNGARPAGTIKLTMGSASCSLDLSKGQPEFTDCVGHVSPGGSGGGDGIHYSENKFFTITDLKIGDGSGESIKAEYSGDGYYLASASVEKSFNKIDTTLEVRNAYKSETIRAFYDAVLGWKTEKVDGQEPDNRKPTGTITFTIGDTCKMVFSLTDNDTEKTDVDDPYKPIEFSCSDDKTKILMRKADVEGTDSTSHQRIWSFKDVLLAVGNSADRIKAEYSGDAVFNPSSSEYLLLDTIPTTLEIPDQEKQSSGTVNLKTELTWHKEALSGKLPTGTIKLTVGQNTCTIDITLDDKEEAKPRLTDCEAGDIIFTRGTDTKVYDTVTNKGFYKMEVKGLKIGDGSGESIKAEYSGDGYYLASASVEKSFNKIDTTLEVKDAYKSETIRAFYDAVLGWETEKVDGQEPDNRKPTGTITFTIGDTCKMVFSLTDNDTAKTDVDDPYKPIEFSCSDEKTKILMRKADVDGTDSTSHQRTWSFRDVLLAVGNSADRIKAEYSGDAAFNPSTSEFLLLQTIPTTLDVSNQVKKAVKSEETGETSILVDLIATLGWNIKPISEAGPTGAIKLTMGSASCSLDLSKERPEFTDCDGHVRAEGSGGGSGSTYSEKMIFTITDLKIGDGSGESIKAEYSGDGYYLASASEPKFFDKYDTEISVDKAYKSAETRVNFESVLSWEVDEDKPTGVITYMIGSDSCKLTLDPFGDPIDEDVNIEIDENNKNRKQQKNFTCSDTTTKVWMYQEDTAKQYRLVFTDVLLSAGNTADRVKADYAGDLLFNASSSEMKLFQTIPTTLKIEIADRLKQPSGTVDLKTVLTWSDEPVSGELPSGTIKLTVGQNVCTLNITLDDTAVAKPRLTDCEAAEIVFARGTDTKLYDTDTQSGFYQLAIKGLKIGDGSGTSIKAEYSGDGVYLTSASDEMFFDKVDTSIDVKDAFKPDVVRATFDSILTWNKDKANGRKPTGTVTFTIGADACRLVIDPADPEKYTSFSCTTDGTDGTEIHAELGEEGTDEKLTWNLVQILLSQNNTSDRVKAEYSGDAVFNASSSNFVLFQTIPTTLDLSGQSKSGSGLVNVTTTLSWTDDPLDVNAVPSGTIKLTMGANSCTLNIGPAAFFTDCKFGPKGKVTPNLSVPKAQTYSIEGLVMGDGAGDSIKAEYSGGGLFLPSASAVKSFDKYDTELDIEKAKKAGTSYADLNTLLTWNKTEAGAKVPTGTITLTIGGDSCKLTFDDASDGNVKDFTCKEKDTTVITPSSADSASDPDKKKTITWKMLNIMLSSGSTADRVKAEYSGDANFNPSTTEFVLFESIPTELKIIRMYQDFDPGEYYIILQLSWTEEPSESGRIPTGTINLKVGDKVCPLRLTGTTIHSDICNVYGIDGVPSGKIWQFTLHELEMGKISKNSASMEYLGDNLFRASKYEHKVDTQTDIDSARMMPDGTVAITFMQKWDQFLAGMERFDHNDYAFRPSGTFKITVGASSCTMQLKGTADPVFTDCDVRAAKLEYVGSNIREVYPKYTIEGLKIGDGTADGIKVEYSGDDLFNPSSSKTKYFDKADTVITVSKAFKSGDIRANWTSVLSWDTAAAGTDIPIGVITFAVGSDSCKLTLDPIKGTETNPKKQTNFTCADSTTEVWLDQGTAGQYMLTFTNVLLTAGNTPDRIKADYAGDALFNASASDFLLFETIPTTTTLGIGLDKTPTGLVNADITLRWESTPLAVGTPQGTIKLTSGSAACTLDLAANPVRFTDCSSNTVTVTPGDKQLTFTVKNLNMGAGAGEDLKAEYSGSGSFLPSASDKMSFTKVGTTLEINSAYKPGDPGLVNLVTTLSWDAEGAYTRKPTGTIKFTAGSTTCDLDLTTRILTCGSKPVADWDRTGSNYRIVIEEMLLSDTSAARIKAEYSGDAVFNPSTAETVLFKTVDTEISVAAASKFDAQHATVSALLNWDESIADGRKPTGTVKFVIGSGNCTLTIETGKLSCEPGTGTVSADRKSYRGTRMLLDDSSADRVSVEYSGDGFFNPSTSTRVLFDRIDTTISMNKAYRYIKSDNKGYVWLDSLLNWDETEAEGRKPTGTIKITIKDKIAEYDMTAKTLTIAGEQISTESIVDSSNSPEQLIFMNLPLDAENAVNSRIEYSGDLYFGPSSTSIVYDKLPVGLKVEEVKYSRNEDASPRTYNFNLKVSFKNIASILNDVDFNGKLKTEITFNYDYYGDEFTITCENHSCTGVNDPYQMSANISMASGYFELDIMSAKYHWSTDHPKWITIRASYDGTEDLLYESSNTSYIYNSKNSLPSSIQNINAIQLSNGEKYIAFDLKFTGFYSNGPGSGRVEIITSNGKTCSVSFSGNSHTESAECKVVNIADGDHSTNSGSQVDNWFVKKWTLKGVKFDPNEADKVYIKFLGSTRTYDAHSSAYGESTFTDPTATTLAISSINHTDTGKMNMSLSLQYTAKELSNNYWPGGPLVITKGGYTCTVPLEFSKTERYSASLLSDCGGGTADVWSLTEGRLIIELKGLPITDQTSNTVKAEYMGDWSNKKSEPVTGNLVGKVSSITEGRFTLTYDDEDSRPKLTTTIKTTEEGTTSFPTGKITYKFDQTGNECSVTISKDEQGKAVVDHVSGSCGLLETSSSPSDFTASSSTYEIKFSSIDLSDTKVTISYEGDSQYKPSTDEVRVALCGVAITPVTDNIYSEGRLYFNTGSGTVYYPYYPERYGSNAYSYCQQYPTPSDCHQLAYEFQLKVIVTQPEDSNIDMTGETITFSNGDMSPNSVTCNLISVEGGFGCTTDTKVHFTKTGNKTIKARYAGNSSKMLASANADFPVMIALSLTGEKTASFTDFVFADDESTQFTAGETRAMKAKTFEYGNEGNPVSDPSYVFYTYNRSENRRVKSCTGYGCSLEITADADVVIVEFPGNDSFAPSMMEKTIIKPETGSPVSLDVTIGGG